MSITPQSTSAPVTPNRRANKQYTQLKQAYKAAASAFLVRDYVAAAEHLSVAQTEARAINADKAAWYHALVTGQDRAELDLQRKVAILQTTFLATVSSNPASKPSPEAVPHDIAKWLALPNEILAPAIWLDLIGEASATPPSKLNSGDILPSPNAVYVHPSLVVALALAALKLDDARSARTALEAWFGSVAEDVERVAWQESSAVDWTHEFPVEQDAQAMSSSGVVGHAGAGVPARPSTRRALLASWIKAVDLLTLHVLPRLGEWEAAADFARLQSVENGGWLPDSRVAALLAQIDLLQRQEADAVASRIERRKQIEASKLAASTSSVDKPAYRKDKGKARADRSSASTTSNKKASLSRTSSSSNDTSPKGSPTKSRMKSDNVAPSGPVAATSHRSRSRPSPTGFAALRSSLSTFLSSSTSDSRGASSHSAISRASLRSLIQDDPLRLLSFICLLFAFTSWVRRRRNMGLRALPSIGDALGSVGQGSMVVLGKLGEFVRMGTKVTQL